MKNIIFFSAFVFICFLGSDCKKKPTQPPDEEQPLDSTSHEFVWQIDTLGDGKGSILYDVAIINDTLIYSVGEIYLKDSTGKFDPQPYNVAIWNGKKWTLRKVPYHDQGYDIVTPINSILAFGENDIWFEYGIHWNGKEYQTLPMGINFPSHANKMWGTSSNDFYVVGIDGLIAHRDANGVWTKLESGTTLPIIDIWGSKNSATGATEILAVGSDPFVDKGNKLLSIKDSQVDSLSTIGLNWTLAGIWFEAGKKYYAVGGGMYTKNSIETIAVWDTLKGLTIYKINAIRGTGLNNIIVAGAFGACMHFNGNTWRSYPELMINGSYYNVDFKNKAVVICGYTGSNAIVAIGKQY